MSVKTITVEQRDRLAELIADARALNEIQHRLVKLAEDITEDYDDNTYTFDVCNNSDSTVDELLALLGVTVESEAA